MQGDFSDAVPFLKRPINLDGEYAGDVGFDPLVSSFSDMPKETAYPQHLTPFHLCMSSCYSGTPTLTYTLTFRDGSL